MAYLKWHQLVIKNFSDRNINELYNKGYLFGRIKRGQMDQTRALRINLKEFKLSSENRRILRKTEGIKMKVVDLPWPDYTWQIGKLAKDFYANKFGDGTFSANKIKELISSPEKSNFNKLFIYSGDGIGYCVCLETDKLLHYCYPFYDAEKSPKNMGLGMMIRAVQYAQEKKLDYVYLGSASRPSDTYKLQFNGMQWFDGKEWKDDLKELKKVL